VREFKFGRGYDNGPVFGDVTGRLASGITLVNQPIVCYYTCNNFLSQVIERRIPVDLFRLQSTIADFFSSNINNRVFFYQAISTQDGTIYSSDNGNMEQMPMDQSGMFIRAAVVELD
jgi:hypothetical protein